MPPPKTKRWRNLEEAATYTGLTKRQMHRAAKAGRVAYYKLSGPTGRLIFRTEDLDAFLAACRVEVSS